MTEVVIEKESESPFISVIIPTYNRAHELKRAVSSVLNQDYPHFDLWVIDDGSTDNTLEVIEDFKKNHSSKKGGAKPPKIHYIKTENRGGAARNTGIHHSKGRWCAFLDSDDEWLKDKLSSRFVSFKPTLIFPLSMEKRFGSVRGGE